MLEVRIVLLSFVWQTVASSSNFQGDQVWRIFTPSEKHVKSTEKLLEGNRRLDVWRGMTMIDRSLDVQIPEDQLHHVQAQLKRHKLLHKVLIEDVQKLINNSIKRRRKREAPENITNIDDFNYEIYHTAEEVEEWMDLVVKEYDFVTKFLIGVTYQGRRMYALKVSKPASSGKSAAIYVDSLIHSREWIATASMLYVFKEILTNSSLVWMTDGLIWYFVPMVNIDGYIYTWTTNRMWRKTMSEQASLRCFGTDANRNFNDHWEGPQGSSSEPCSSIYRGPIPESESETRHLARFINAHNDSITAVVTVHSYAQLILYPYNYELGVYPRNNNEQNETAAAMSAAMYSVNNVTYNFGPAAETLAVATGVTTDWTQAKANIDINYTIELRDTGEFGFLLPEDEIIPTGKELLAGLQVLAHKAKYDS